MKAMVSAALTWAALGASSVAAAAEESPAAVLTLANGTVAVRRGAEKLAAKPPFALFPGDVVEVQPHAKAILIFPHGAPKEIVATGVTAGFRVEKQIAGAQAGGGALARLWRYVLSLVAPRGPKRVAPAARGGEDVPEGLWPCDSLVRQERPTFAWQPVAQASYQVVVLSGKGEEVWRSPTTTTTQLTYPDDAAALTPGVKYWWEVLAMTEDEMTAAGPYWMQIMPPEQAAEVDKLLAQAAEQTKDSAESARTTARALVLAAEGLRAEALSLLATLAQHQPPTRREAEQLTVLVAAPPTP